MSRRNSVCPGDVRPSFQIHLPGQPRPATQRVILPKPVITLCLVGLLICGIRVWTSLPSRKQGKCFCVCWVTEIFLLNSRRYQNTDSLDINPEYSFEGLMLILQYFDHLMQRTDSLEKALMLGKIEGRRRRGRTTEDEMVGWHHRLNGHESGWTPGVGDGQGGLACCNPWGPKESDTTEQVNNNNNNKIRTQKDREACIHTADEESTQLRKRVSRNHFLLFPP